MTGSKEWPEVSEPIVKRISPSLFGYLKNLWQLHSGSSSFFLVNPGVFFGMNMLDYSTYNIHQCEIMLALEYLAKMNLIDNNNLIMNKRGQIKENSTVQDWEEFAERNSLNRARICVVGGHEGRIFAQMGAWVMGVDPYLNVLQPPLSLAQNLEEHPYVLYEDLARNNTDQFDLTFSSWLFDWPSGIQDPERVMRHILTMTKVGGYSMHNGKLIPKIAELVRDIARVVEIVPYSKHEKIGQDIQVYFVLQKN